MRNVCVWWGLVGVEGRSCSGSSCLGVDLGRGEGEAYAHCG